MAPLAPALTPSPNTGDPALTLCVPPPAGRGLLHWENKHNPAPVAIPQVQVCADYGTDTGDESTLANRLYHGDNLAVLAHLLESGWARRFRLIYIDPPFDSGLAYAGKIRSRGRTRRTLGEQVQYRDIWQGDDYLQFMYARLLLLRPLLAEDGVIWLHCDYRQSHRLQLVLEEVFGAENYLNTIAWRSQVARGAKVNAFYFPNSTHFLHVFARDRQADPVWQPPRKKLVFSRRQAAAQFMEDEQGFFRTSDPGSYSFARLKELHAQGRLYAPYGGEVHIDDDAQTITCTNGGNLGVKYYLTQEAKNRFSVERAVDNLWDDIPGLGTTPGEDVGYPTQKTEALLERVITASSAPGDWVLDCFAGSGTTPVVAQRLKRHWVACDVGAGAVQTIRRRLLADHPTSPDGHAETAPNLRFTLFSAIQSAGNDPSAADLQPVTKPTPAPPVLTARIAPTATGDQIRVEPAHPCDDWRTWIDAIEIDPCYDGAILRPQLWDAPANRRELVRGHYSLSAAAYGPRVAVRIAWITGQSRLFVLGRETTNSTD